MTDLVKFENGKVVTTSLLVAEKFGKEHFHVLRDIEELLSKEDNPNLGLPLMFMKSSYISTQNKELPNR